MSSKPTGRKLVDNRVVAYRVEWKAKEGMGTIEVKINSESFYKISNYDAMRPFFMSIVSNSNHWMFISSTGGLTAGRKNSEYALFPYYTDDKITESSEYTGSKTICLVERKDKDCDCKTKALTQL